MIVRFTLPVQNFAYNFLLARDYERGHLLRSLAAAAKMSVLAVGESEPPAMR